MLVELHAARFAVTVPILFPEYVRVAESHERNLDDLGHFARIGDKNGLVVQSADVWSDYEVGNLYVHVFEAPQHAHPPGEYAQLFLSLAQGSLFQREILGLARATGQRDLPLVTGDRLRSFGEDDVRLAMPGVPKEQDGGNTRNRRLIKQV